MIAVSLLTSKTVNKRGLLSWAPFLETLDNVPIPKTVLCAQCSLIVMQFLLILKAKF